MRGLILESLRSRSDWFAASPLLVPFALLIIFGFR